MGVRVEGAVRYPLRLLLFRNKSHVTVCTLGEYCVNHSTYMLSSWSLGVGVRAGCAARYPLRLLLFRNMTPVTVCRLGEYCVIHSFYSLSFWSLGVGVRVEGLVCYPLRLREEFSRKRSWIAFKS